MEDLNLAGADNIFKDCDADADNDNDDLMALTMIVIGKEKHFQGF